MSFHLSTDSPPTCPMIQLFGSSCGHDGSTPNRGDPKEPGARYAPPIGLALVRAVPATQKTPATSTPHSAKPVNTFARNVLTLASKDETEAALNRRRQSRSRTLHSSER